MTIEIVRLLIYGKGVLWSGDYTFPGTAETLELLRSRGKYLKKGLHDNQTLTYFQM
jgi:hypothetical protein